MTDMKSVLLDDISVPFGNQGNNTRILECGIAKTQFLHCNILWPLHQNLIGFVNVSLYNLHLFVSTDKKSWKAAPISFYPIM